MNATSAEYSVEDSPFGRVVVPSPVPAGVALFYTTADFDGRLSNGGADLLMAYAQERFGVRAALATCVQVHGRVVNRIKRLEGWLECDSCDALWTDASKVALGIKVADCLPVSMLDPVHEVIANVHSGWRGAVQRITDGTVDALESASDFDPGEALAFLGPAIRQCCFEVGEEVADQFMLAYSDAGAFIDRSRSKPHIDTAGLTRQRLLARGFAASRIFDTGLCTRCDGSMFHSYRRGTKGGRNLAVLAQ